MVRSDENNPTLFRPIHSSNKNNRIHGDLQAGGKLSMGGAGQNRRALSNINKNVIGVPPYPCAVNKRGLAEKHAVCQKSQPGPGHRPITRKFAAQLASRDETLPKECKKNSQLPSVSSASSDCIIIDAEDCIEINDDTVPMFVQHTEAVLEEIDKMEEEEIAMEDIERKSIVDIDSPDKKNPRAVVEYIDDLYKNYRKAESSGCASANYMEQQFDINERMRGILIDWLIEVHYKFELMEETLYLTINLIDRFLASQTVVRKKLQLVGVTAMLLACKYEEVIVPVMEDLILISDKAYTRKEVLDMEKLMLNTLQFNLSIPTPYVFMKRFLKAAESDKKLELVSFFLIELCLVEYEMLQFPPSLLAAAAVFTAQCTLTGSKQWSKTSQRYTNYSKEQLFECSRMMVRFHQKAGMGKLTGVHRKYSLSKYGYAANSEPAHFLLEDRSYLIKANDDGC